MRDELIRESARTADAVQRADHFEKRLDAANSLGKAAREELAQAKTRIAELEQTCRYEADLCEQALESRKHAEARIAELEKDAARYRWLRAQMHFTKSHDKPAFMWVEINASETHDFDFEFISPHFEASVDRTIDAAMTKEAP